MAATRNRQATRLQALMVPGLHLEARYTRGTLTYRVGYDGTWEERTDRVVLSNVDLRTRWGDLALHLAQHCREQSTLFRVEQRGTHVELWKTRPDATRWLIRTV